MSFLKFFIFIFFFSSPCSSSPSSPCSSCHFRSSESVTIVLKESPILLYSASPLDSSASPSTTYCGHCFKTLSSFSSSFQSQHACLGCSHEFLYNPHCYSSSSHTPWACQTLLRLWHSLCRVGTDDSLDLHHQARFLVAAYNLALQSSSLFHTLLSLHDSPDDSSSSIAAHFLHPLVSPPTSFSVEVTTAMLAKDKLNVFGLMEPFLEWSEQGDNRSVRAYGIYLRASLFNHDCLPNACHFDYVDTADMDITVRMIHDVPAGREICVCYFLVNQGYRMRQRRLVEGYRLTCDCNRFKVEANSLEDDDNATMEEEEEEEEQVTIDSKFPHTYFFLRYICSRSNCGGTRRMGRRRKKRKKKNREKRKENKNKKILKTTSF